MLRFTGLLLILGMVCLGCSPPAGDVEQPGEAPALQETAPGPASNETVVPSEPVVPTEPAEEPMAEPVEEPAEPAETTPAPMEEAGMLPPSVEQVPANETKEMPAEEPTPPAEESAPPAKEMKPETPAEPAESNTQVDVEGAVQPTPADEVEGLLEEAAAAEAEAEPMPESDAEAKAEEDMPAEAETPAEQDEPAEPVPSPQTSQPAADEAKMEKPEEEENAATASGSATTKLSAENTLIQFVGTHKGDKPDPRTGKFNRFSGEAKAEDGKLASVTVEIETESLETEIEKLTNHLKSPDFFDVRQHPKATFKSTKIESGDAGTVTVTGDLTLLGKTKSITFPAKVTIADEVNLTAEFEIDRTEFGMNYGADNVHKEIAMTVKVGK